MNFIHILSQIYTVGLFSLIFYYVVFAEYGFAYFFFLIMNITAIIIQIKTTTPTVTPTINPV